MAAPPDENQRLAPCATTIRFVAAAQSPLRLSLTDFQPEHAKWLIDKKKAAEAAGGTLFNSILDKLNVEICLGTVWHSRLSRSQAFPLGFLWIRLVSVRPITRKEPGWRYGRLRPLQEKGSGNATRRRKNHGLPVDLAATKRFVRQTLADNRKRGRGIKFEAAYFPRSISCILRAKNRRKLRQVSRRRRARRTGKPAIPGLFFAC